MIEVNYTPTPEEMAEWFWEMKADEQVKMFEELHKISDSYSRQMQGYGMENSHNNPDCFTNNHKAREAAMDLFAPLFWHTLNNKYDPAY